MRRDVVTPSETEQRAGLRQLTLLGSADPAEEQAIARRYCIIECFDYIMDKLLPAVRDQNFFF